MTGIKKVRLYREDTKHMKINNFINDLVLAKSEIENNAIYYNTKWKIDQLEALKKKMIADYDAAISEYESEAAKFDSQIKKIEGAQFVGFSSTPDFRNSVEYAKSRLLAEINLSPHDREKIINKALGSRTGAQAVLEMIQTQQLDNSFWTDETYKKAFINSKTQQELDFEIKKEEKLQVVKQQKADTLNHGSYYAARKLMQGDVAAGTPTLARQLELEIESLEQQLESELNAGFKVQSV